MENKFLMKIYRYVAGQLSVAVREFDKIEDAIEHGAQVICHSFKIYDVDGNLCHHHQHDDDCHDTYA